MKRIITIILVLISLITIGQTSDEMSMVSEINGIRTNPKSYIPKVETYIKGQEVWLEKFDSPNHKVMVTSTSGTLTKTNSVKNTNTVFGKDVFIRNIKVAKELISILDTLTPMDTLIFDSTMYLITKSHGNYLSSVNQNGHYGPKGQSVNDRFKHLGYLVSENCGGTLISLMVDSGIPGYGHRYTIINPKLSHISIYKVLNHPTWGSKYVVQNFR